MRAALIVFLAALLAANPLALAHGGQAEKGAKGAKKARAKAVQAVQAPALSRRELLAPYSAHMQQTAGPHPVAGSPAMSESLRSNATSWKLDLAPAPKRDGDDSQVQFRLGRERAVDPITGKELTPRADPLGARKSLEDLDLKGAADKLGGKAEVQVDVLKF